MSQPQLTPVELPVWTYTAPHIPKDYPEQSYYGVNRGDSEHGMSCFPLEADHPYRSDELTSNDASVYRISGSVDANLQVSNAEYSVRVRINLESLTRLINALSDARHDVQQELERRRLSDSLREIREELDERGEHGAACYYGHPWVFYVAPGQAAAKCQELNAQGLAEYIVLEDASLAAASATEEAPAP